MKKDGFKKMVLDIMDNELIKKFELSGTNIKPENIEDYDYHND